MKIKVVSHAAIPVHKLHDMIQKHVPHPRAAGKVLLCTTIILTGSSIALIHTPTLQPEHQSQRSEGFAALTCSTFIL